MKDRYNRKLEKVETYPSFAKHYIHVPRNDLN